MFGRYCEEFRAGPQAWTDGEVSRLWSLLTDCREGPEIAAGLLAAGHDPADNRKGWLWLIGHFLEERDRAKANRALRVVPGLLARPRGPVVPAPAAAAAVPLDATAARCGHPASRALVTGRDFRGE